MSLDRTPASSSLIIVWILLGVVLLWAASWPPVSRTQEARVLETAREMAERPVPDWGIPRLNGAVRLRKPPLAYWLSATSFRLFGVTDFAGRLPMVLLSWATLGTTFLIARRLFDARAAVFAVAVLVGTWLFFRFGLLAETDGPSAAFLTAGVYTFLRATDAPRGRDGKWQHATAACGAAVVMCKGPPVLYLILFAVALCGFRRQWRPIGRFFTSGAIVTALVLAVPWFVYVFRRTTEEGQLGVDLANSAEGGDHHGPPWVYGPMLLQATLPWTPVWVAALLVAAGRMRRDVAAWRAKQSFTPATGLWVVAIWAVVVLVPLAGWGNKQLHYLLPLMPPTAILVGWATAEASRGREKGVKITAGVLLALLSLTGPAVLIAAFRLRPTVHVFDIGLNATMVALAFVSIVLWRRRGFGYAFAPMAALALATMFAVHAWLPPIIGGKSRNTAMELATAYPDARFVFRNSELPVMSWAMRRAVPGMDDIAIAAAGADPKTVVLDQQQDDEALPDVPPGFVRIRRMRQGMNVLHVYVPDASPWRISGEIDD